MRFDIAASLATNIATSEDCSPSVSLDDLAGFDGNDCSNLLRNPLLPFSRVPVGQRLAHPRRMHDEHGKTRSHLHDCQGFVSPLVVTHTLALDGDILRMRSLETCEAATDQLQ